MTLYKLDDSDVDSIALSESDNTAVQHESEHDETFEIDEIVEIEDIPVIKSDCPMFPEITEVIEDIIDIAKIVEEIKNEVINVACSKDKSLFFVSDQMHKLQQKFAVLDPMYNELENEILQSVKQCVKITEQRKKCAEQIISSFFNH